MVSIYVFALKWYKMALFNQTNDGRNVWTGQQLFIK